MIFYKIIASLLLLFNGIGALYGGWSLITQPDGSGLQLSLDLLEQTPFQNYLIPGITLFVANGLCSLAVFVVMMLNIKVYSWLVMLQGAVLTGWIVIQMILIQTVYFLHIILGSIGLLLIVCGWVMVSRQKNKS
jgi:hypothetical protein